MDFWKNTDLGFATVCGKIDQSINGLGYVKTIKNLLAQDNGHMTKTSYAGTVSENEDFFLQKINNLGARLLIKSVYHGLNSYVFIWNDAILDLDFNTSTNHANLSAFGTNEELVISIKNIFSDKFITPAKQGFIFAIMNCGGALQLTRIGYAGVELEPRNYSKQIIADFDYIVKDLKSPQPSGRISIFDGSPGTGKCIAEGSLLMNYSTGLLESVEKIIENKSKVLTFDLDNGIIGITPSDWICTGQKECIEILTKSGNIISGTPEHPVLTVDGWKTLNEINKDDYIGLARDIPFPEKKNDISDEDIYLLSGLLAEGGYTSNHVSFTNETPEICNIFNESLKSVDACLKQYKCHEKFEYRVISPLIGRKSKIRIFLDSYGLGHTLSKNKSLPDCIFSLSETKLCKFIGYFWSCDGSISNRNTITLCLASEKMIDQFQHLLLRLGILCNKRYKIITRENKEFYSWEITVLSSSKENFKNKIPLYGPKKLLLENMIIHNNPNDDLIPLTKNLKNKINFILKDFIKSGHSLKEIANILSWNKKKISSSSFLRRKHLSRRVFNAILSATKNKDLIWISKLRWSKIKNKKNVGVKNVYDLTIPKYHSFLANDIVVHNTFLARSILTLVPDALFVLVPPNMISSLGGPELLPILLQHKESYNKSGPTVFILEDADHCLVPRGPDNIDSISAILNLGDGIFGSLFDIRIVATTNAKKAEIDPAIIRAGRLSKRIEIGKLNYDEASTIFKRLIPDGIMPKILNPEEYNPMKPHTGDNKYSLAEVYKAARDAGWEPVVPKENGNFVEMNGNTVSVNEDYDDDIDDDEDDNNHEYD